MKKIINSGKSNTFVKTNSAYKGGKMLTKLECVTKKILLLNKKQKGP